MAARAITCVLAPLSPASCGNLESIVFFPSPLPSKLCAALSPHCSHRPPHPTGATAPLSHSEAHTSFLLCLKHAPAPFVPLLPLFKPRASNTEPPRPFLPPSLNRTPCFTILRFTPPRAPPAIHKLILRLPRASATPFRALHRALLRAEGLHRGQPTTSLFFDDY